MAARLRRILSGWLGSFEAKRGELRSLRGSNMRGLARSWRQTGSCHAQLLLLVYLHRILCKTDPHVSRNLGTSVEMRLPSEKALRSMQHDTAKGAARQVKGDGDAACTKDQFRLPFPGNELCQIEGRMATSSC